jgi:antitoxin (DNA-binding transcriptional repressor) of toxin-antitoxin stability system
LTPSNFNRFAFE